METLVLAVCDSEDPEGHLAGLLDGLVEDPGHRRACGACERAILQAAEAD